MLKILKEIIKGQGLGDTWNGWLWLRLVIKFIVKFKIKFRLKRLKKELQKKMMGGEKIDYEIINE